MCILLDSRIKKILEDIIDVAYAGTDIPEDIKKRFKWFKLNILTKELARTNGDYNTHTHIVRVYNAHRGVCQMAKTCLHEVAHHIVWCLYKNDVKPHGEEFYDNYAMLIYAALDMKILTPDDFLNDNSKDNEKVAEILEDYDPMEVDYRMDNPTIIKVRNSYKVKDALKEHGYKWNNMEQTWEKFLEDETENDEKAFLAGIGVASVDPGNRLDPWYVIEGNNMYIDAYVLIEAVGDTYELREHLKRHGFTFNTNKKKAWTCKVKASEYEQKMLDIMRDEQIGSNSNIRFELISRKSKKRKKKPQQDKNEQTGSNGGNA